MFVSALAIALQLACTVIDGDTIRCGDERIRLAGIDAPETGGRAQCESEREGAQRATEALRREIARPGLHIERLGLDRYGRTRAILRDAEGHSINDRLVAEGYAVVWAGRRHQWCEG